MICLGCRESIDDTFDSVSRDDRGRPWHTNPCWVERVGAQDRDVNPNGELAAFALSPSLWVGARAWDRLRGRR